MQHFANRTDSVFNGKFGRNRAKNEISEFIDFMKNESALDKKQQYINEITGQDIPLYWQRQENKRPQAGENYHQQRQAWQNIESQARETYNANTG